MKVRIIESYRDLYIYQALDNGINFVCGDYGVFEIIDIAEIQNGEVLSGDFENVGEFNVYQVSSGNILHISNEDWGMSLAHARQRIYAR